MGYVNLGSIKSLTSANFAFIASFKFILVD